MSALIIPSKIPVSFDTERLTIRAPRAGDGRVTNEAILETWEGLHEWMPWARVKPTVQESEMQACHAWRVFQAREELQYRMFLKGTHTVVGSSGLHRIDWSLPRFEIGYWCRKRFQGQGYVVETVRGLTTLAFETLGAVRVEIRCDARNDASARVAERAGYCLEGILRQDARAPDGSLRDTMVFGLVRDDYSALRETMRKGITGLPCPA